MSKNQSSFVSAECEIDAYYEDSHATLGKETLPLFANVDPALGVYDSRIQNLTDFQAGIPLHARQC